jgi:hypothetical protein
MRFMVELTKSEADGVCGGNPVVAVAAVAGLFYVGVQIGEAIHDATHGKGR